MSNKKSPSSSKETTPIRERKLSGNQLKTVCWKARNEGGRLLPGPEHLIEAMVKRGFDMNDVIEVLRNGKMHGEPRRDKNGDWEYALIGSVEKYPGEKWIVAVKPIAENAVVVKTGYPQGRKDEV